MHAQWPKCFEYKHPLNERALKAPSTCRSRTLHSTCALCWCVLLTTLLFVSRSPSLDHQHGSSTFSQQILSHSPFLFSVDLFFELEGEVREIYPSMFLSKRHHSLPLNLNTGQRSPFKFLWADLVQESRLPSLHLKLQCWTCCRTPGFHNIFILFQMQSQVFRWFIMLFVWQGNRIPNA